MSSIQPIKLAIADDHVLFRKGLYEILTGFKEFKLLFEASNGKELIEKIESSVIIPDVCIIDINMPVMNGYETAAAIKEQWPKIKMLALSMYDSEFNIIKMITAGANGYVLKDAEPVELMHAIRSVYEYNAYHSELITDRMLKIVNEAKSGDYKVNLNEKEMQFLGLCCSDLTYKDIADKMQLSPRTIDGYRDSLFSKLNIKSRTGLVVYAIRAGIVTI